MYGMVSHHYINYLDHTYLIVRFTVKAPECTVISFVKTTHMLFHFEDLIIFLHNDQ